MKLENIIEAISKQLPDKSNELALLGDINRPNSWTFSFKTASDKRVLKILKNNPQNSLYDNNEEEANLRIKSVQGIKVAKVLANGEILIGGKKFSYMEFEYIEGQDVDNLLRASHQFTEEQVLDFLKDMTETILGLARLNIIHQDIKPANVTLTNDGPVLLDLGIARFIDHGFKLAKQQGPAKYLSPEQVQLGNKRDPSQQRKVTFLSDIYSLGVVALEMLLGNRFKDIWRNDSRHTAYSEVENLDINNNELKDLLEAYLQVNPIDRLKEASGKIIKFLKEEKKVINFELPEVWFLHMSGPKLETILQFINENTDVKDGIIFNSDNISSLDKRLEVIKQVQSEGWKIIIDPDTFKLPYRSEYHASLKDRKYYLSGVVETDFYKSNLLPNFTKEVIDFQTYFSPDYYVSPYFLIDSNSSFKEIHFAFYEETVSYLKNKGIEKPLLFGVGLSSELICNTEAIKGIINELALLKSVSGFYIRPELIKQDNAPCKDVDYLKNLRLLCECLSLDKDVLLVQVDQSSLGLMSNSDIKVAINPEIGFRKQDIDNKLSSDKVTGGPKAEDKRFKLYVPQLLNDMDIKRDMEPTSKTFDELRCNCPYCKVNSGNENKDLRNLHFMMAFREQAMSIQAQKIEDRPVVLKKMLNEAKEYYKRIYLEGLRLHKESEGTFIDSWERAFC